jgi:hypothetical protein
LLRPFGGKGPTGGHGESAILCRLAFLLQFHGFGSAPVPLSGIKPLTDASTCTGTVAPTTATPVITVAPVTLAPVTLAPVTLAPSQSIPATHAPVAATTTVSPPVIGGYSPIGGYCFSSENTVEIMG